MTYMNDVTDAGGTEFYHQVCPQCVPICHSHYCVPIYHWHYCVPVNRPSYLCLLPASRYVTIVFQFTTLTIVFRFTTGTIAFRLTALPICAYFLLPGMSLLCSILLPLLVCSILLPLLLCSILPLLILCPTPGLQVLHTRSVFSHSARDQHERRHGRGLHIKNTPDTSPDLFFFFYFVSSEKTGCNYSARQRSHIDLARRLDVYASRCALAYAGRGFEV